MNRLPISVLGNKYNDAKHFIKHLPAEYDKIIEPFCGSAGLSRRLFNSVNVPIYLYDIDGELINIYNNIENYIDSLNSLLTHIEAKYAHDLGVAFYDHKELARCVDDYCEERGINQFKSNLYKTLNLPRTSTRPATTKKKHEYNEFKKFVNTAQFECGDYREKLEQYKDDEHAFIFLDPPYLNDSKNRCYAEDVKSNDFVYICELLKTYKCKILLCIQHEPALDYIFRKFKVGEYNKTYCLSGKRVKI